MHEKLKVVACLCITATQFTDSRQINIISKEGVTVLAKLLHSRLVNDTCFTISTSATPDLGNHLDPDQLTSMNQIVGSLASNRLS